MHAGSLDDKDLFHQIAGGDETAFRQLFHRYVPELRPLVLHLTRTAAVTDDIIQETFLRLWINRDQLLAIESPRAWLLRIVFNQSFSFLRKQAVHHKALHVLADGPSGADANTTEDTVAYAAMAKAVGDAVSRLPPQAKRIYLLSRERGLKIPEIAAQLDLSPNTVKNSLVRSLQFIRKHLEASGYLISLVLAAWLWP